MGRVWKTGSPGIKCNGLKADGCKTEQQTGGSRNMENEEKTKNQPEDG